MTEIHELESGLLVAFPDHGCHVWQPGGWEFVPGEDPRWDAWHQQVYRNHRATPLGPGELERRGIPPPPVSAPPRRPVSRAAEEVTAAGLPPAALERLRRRLPAYLLLQEDEYESCFGDGVFLYPHQAFWDAAAARERLAALEAGRPAEGLDYRYSLVEVPLELDETRGVVTAAMDLPPYARCGLGELLALLGRALG